MRGLRVVPMSLDDAEAIIEGRRPDEVDWAEGYPAESTLVAAAIVVVAAREGRGLLAPWGIFQIVRDGRVVGGAGFLGPLDDDGCVQIGFSETEAARANDDVANALAVLIGHARDHGARTVRAEAGTERAAEVLAAAGMRERAVTDGVRLFEA